MNCNVMTCFRLYKYAKETREAQKAYFRSRDINDLRTAKAMERELDKAIDTYARIFADPSAYAAFRERCREYERLYRERRRARLAADPAALAAHKAKCRALKAEWDAKTRRLKAQSHEYYALWRAERRARYAAGRVAAGKIYYVKPSLRIPDWATFGQKVLDTSSPWLIENVTPSQRAFARELAIERRSV